MLMNPRYGGKKVERVENMDDRELLDYVVDQLTATLLSKTEGSRKGFSSVTRLVECFQMDTGLYPHEVAMRLGFSNFEVFIKSTEMKKYITISLLPDGRTFFSAKLKEDWNNGPLAPVLDRRTGTESVALRKVQEEHDKFARAMLEENQGRLLEGRMQLAEIVHLCGGQENNVSLQELRDGYAKKYKMELTKEVLKSYFQRDKFGRIILDFCHNELELLTSQDNCVYFLKLRRPYKEIQENFAALLDQQRNPPASTSAGYSSGGRAPFRRLKDTFGERRVLNIAPVNPDLFGDEEMNVESVFGSTPTTENVSNANKFDLVDWTGSSNAISITEASPLSVINSLSGSMHTLNNQENLEDDWRSVEHNKLEPRNEEFQDLWQDLDETSSEDDDDAKLDQENYDDPVLVDVLPEKPLKPVVDDVPNSNSNHHSQTNQAKSSSCSQKTMPQVIQPSIKSSILIDFWKDEENGGDQINYPGGEFPAQAQPSSSRNPVVLDKSLQDKPKKTVKTRSSEIYQPMPFRSRGLDEGPEMVLDSNVQETAIHTDPENLEKKDQHQQCTTINPAEFMPPKVDDHKVHSLVQLIEALVLYRSITKQTTKLDLLVKALQKINYGHESVMDPQDVLKFVKEHCKGLKIFSHDGEPVFCCTTHYSASNSHVQPKNTTDSLQDSKKKNAAC